MKKNILLIIVLVILSTIPVFAAGEQTGYQRLKNLMDQKTGVENEITFSEDYKHATVKSSAWTNGEWDIALLDTEPNTEGLKNFYNYILYDDKYNKLGYVLAVKSGTNNTQIMTKINQEANTQTLSNEELVAKILEIERMEKEQKEANEKSVETNNEKLITELAKKPVETLTNEELVILIKAMEKEANLASASEIATISNASLATTSNINEATISNAA